VTSANEQAATEFARNWFKGILPWVFDRRKGAAAEMAEQEYRLRRRAALHPKRRSEASRQCLFDAAVNGDNDAACALLDEIIDCLSGPLRTARLPSDILDKYAVLALQQRRISISKKRRGRQAVAGGRESIEHYTRNWLITGCVAALLQFGLSPTRSKETKQKQRRESCCSVVTAVLAERGVYLPEDTVAKIWERAAEHGRPVRNKSGFGVK
jgi:hypothetical protein